MVILVFTNCGPPEASIFFISVSPDHPKFENHSFIVANNSFTENTKPHLQKVHIAFFQITGKTKHHLKTQDLMFLVSGNTSVIPHAKVCGGQKQKTSSHFLGGEVISCNMFC